MKKSLTKFLENNKSFGLLILPLISSASVLRKYNILKLLLSLAKQNGIKNIEVYETLLQTYLFAGFPSALISLQIASSIFPFKKLKSNIIADVRISGERSCKKIYGVKFNKLINNVSNFSPELSNWLITEGYGKVLSRKGLSLAKRELCIVAILSSLKFENQLYSHINGAVRLYNSVNDLKLVIDCLKYTGGSKTSDFANKVLHSYLKQKNGKSLLQVS